MMIRRPLVCLAVATCLSLAAPASSSAATGSVSGDPDPSCVFLLPDGGGTLLNRCDGCREVTLERMHSSDSAPLVRALMVPGQSLAPLPFRAAGRIRIIGERACPPPPGRGSRQTALGQ